MPYYLVSVNNWEEPGIYGTDKTYDPGEAVIVQNNLGNKDFGIILKESAAGDEKGKIMRGATKNDAKSISEHRSKRAEYLESCRHEIKRLKLEMKLVDALVSMDGKQITFVFTAEGRIDFRELVRNLSQIFKKSIRMQQVGSREESRKLGGYGICGREFCCARFPGSLQSISTEMARAQLIDNRGSDRLSGLCGRLKCCLAFEAEQYREMLENMPEMGSKVKSGDKSGEVIEVNALTGNYKVKLEDGSVITLKKD